jgi:hypothetical protein
VLEGVAASDAIFGIDSFRVDIRLVVDSALNWDDALGADTGWVVNTALNCDDAFRDDIMDGFAGWVVLDRVLLVVEVDIGLGVGHGRLVTSQ